MPPGAPGGPPGDKKKDDKDKEKKKWEHRPPTRAGRRRRKRGAQGANKLPTIFPTAKCKLRLLKTERVKDFLLMEEEFIKNQEVFRPHEEKDQEERDKMEELRGSPLAVGSLEEMIDDNHAIVSSSVGPEYYVSVLSFVNQVRGGVSKARVCATSRTGRPMAGGRAARTVWGRARARSSSGVADPPGRRGQCGGAVG